MGLQTKRLCTQDRRGGSLWGLELFCIQCVVSLGPAGRRCCVLLDYACLLARSVLRTSVAGSGWVLPKHRLITIFSPKFPSPKNIASDDACRSIILYSGNAIFFGLGDVGAEG